MPAPAPLAGARAGDLRTTVLAEQLDAALRSLGGLAVSGPAGGGLRIVDAGGGTGALAVPLAVAGHEVTVIDPSPDSLAALQRRAADAGVAERVHARQGDLADLADHVPDGSADVVLCHRVLEVVDDPPAALRAVSAALRPGGLASVLVANRLALAVHHAVGGRFDLATDLLSLPAGTSPWDRPDLVAVVEQAGLQVQRVQGVRVVCDLVPGPLLDAEPGAPEALLRLERLAGDHPALRDLAGQLHLLARRPG